jgi:hypothetical protein
MLAQQLYLGMVIAAFAVFIFGLFAAATWTGMGGD